MTPLQNNGGLTNTLGLTFGSAAVDAGTTVPGVTPATDQIGNPRVSGASADIGAVEGILPPPDATATFANITPLSPAAGTPTYAFTVKYTAPSGGKIDTTTIGNGDLTFTGPGGYTASATKISFTDPNGDQSVIIASYTIPANTAGTPNWDIADNGFYTGNIVLNQVKTTTNVPVPAGVLGNFLVVFPKTFVVTNTNDSGKGSLRDAIDEANSAAFTGADTITFSDGSGGTTDFTSPQTISVSSTLNITDSLTITGKGANLLTINTAALGFRIFSASETATNLSLSNMTISGASLANTDTGSRHSPEHTEPGHV